LNNHRGFSLPDLKFFVASQFGGEGRVRGKYFYKIARN
jgi:hypothetical protein